MGQEPILFDASVLENAAWGEKAKRLGEVLFFFGLLIGFGVFWFLLVFGRKYAYFNV